jgi:enolase
MKNDDTIAQVHAREVFDSRGNPTIEVEVQCRGGVRGRAIVPSGASTGKHEALELRDGDRDRYGGRGVRKAVVNVLQQIAPQITGMPATDQARLDRELCTLDGTPNKARLGANAILGVSLACAHAGAATRQVSLWRYLDRAGVAKLPLPMVNLISGGLHAGGNLDVQDFLVIPIGAHSYSQALQMAVQVYRSLGKILAGRGLEGVLVGDEGGFGPRLQSNEQALDLIVEAIQAAGYTPGRDAGLAVDVASSHFYRDGCYYFSATGGHALSAEGMIDLLGRWIERYPILSIEDGLAEDDWLGWQKLTAALGDRVQLIGDDLFVTNQQRLQRGIAGGAANSVLVKLNQIGTLTETLEVSDLARSAGYRPVISARSGETEDTTIADLAVATGAGQIKIGAVVRSERLAKYNQLLRIEEEMEPNAAYAGWQPVSRPA